MAANAGASIDYGVLVCLNCSGAHRALGPSVTRVKSTKLDTWMGGWFEYMTVGNEACNRFWEANLGLSKYAARHAGSPTPTPPSTRSRSSSPTNTSSASSSPPARRTPSPSPASASAQSSTTPP